ncbi:MAG: hypothetical protein HYY01_00885 [Chloroflexi bacterium]|nr:hypothetical protein [Chloroflexota bacterium]
MGTQRSSASARYSPVPAREGFAPVFGARPLRRAIQRHVEKPAVEKNHCWRGARG